MSWSDTGAGRAPAASTDPLLPPTRSLGDAPLPPQRPWLATLRWTFAGLSAERLAEALRGWRLAFFGAAVGVVLVLRGVYLARYGWCPNWMGLLHLEHAKEISLGLDQARDDSPLLPLLLVLLRGSGLGAAEALGALYLLGQVVFLLATLRLAELVWPDASLRRRGILTAAIALVPLLAGPWPHANVSALLGAAFAVAALALAMSAAIQERPSVWRLALAFLFAALAAACRFEGFATGAVGGVTLWVLGPRMAGLPSPRWPAAALALGAALGFAALLVVRHLLSGGASPPGTYGFYTFYDGLPFLMWPDAPDEVDEWGRYLASMEYLGTFSENDGSVLQALLSHPGAAALRFLAKVPDLVGCLAWIESLTPLGLGAALLGMRGLARRREPGAPWSRGWIFLAFAGALPLLFVPPASPQYLLAVLCPLLLAMARGLDLLLWRLSGRAVAGLGAASVAAGLAVVILWGRAEFPSSPVLNKAAAYLEDRCRDGCLTNFLPPALRAQAWVDLQAGSPLPERRARSEDFILDRQLGAYRRGLRFLERVRAARAAGYRGPVLYLKIDVRSAQVFHPIFDLEPSYEGRIDLSRATLEKELWHGSDRVAIYAL